MVYIPFFCFFLGSTQFIKRKTKTFAIGPGKGINVILKTPF